MYSDQVGSTLLVESWNPERANKVSSHSKLNSVSLGFASASV